MKNLNLAIAWCQTCLLVEDVVIVYIVYLLSIHFGDKDVLWWLLLILFNTIPKVLREQVEGKKSVAKEISDKIGGSDEQGNI